jgi:hypothetical protein
MAEMKALDSVESPHRKYWLPAHWAMAAIQRARQQGLIKNDHAVTDLFNVILVLFLGSYEALVVGKYRVFILSVPHFVLLPFLNSVIDFNETLGISRL